MVITMNCYRGTIIYVLNIVFHGMVIPAEIFLCTRLNLENVGYNIIICIGTCVGGAHDEMADTIKYKT